MSSPPFSPPSSPSSSQSSAPERHPLDGQEFASWKEVRQALDNWAVNDKFTYRTPKKVPNSATYNCVSEGCPWRCRVRRISEGVLLLTVVEEQHTCIGAGVGRFRSASRREWLDQAASMHLQVTKATKPADIVDAIRIHYGEEISYKIAQTSRLRLLNGDIGSQRYSFQLLPAYRRRLEETAPDVYFDLAIDPSTGNFKRCFICPAQCRESFRVLRRFVALDRTSLKARFVQMLLLAVGIDADGHNTILAWAIVESENQLSWEWFLRHLQRAIPEVSTEPCVVISDRDKGLLEAEEVLGPLVVRALCCHHLEENFTMKFGQSLSPLFWRIARAQTEAQYQMGMAALKEVKEAGMEYLQSIDRRLWVSAYFPTTRFGHDTSNVVESTNKTLKLDRELPMVDLLNTIWHRVMEQRASRLVEAREAHRKGEQFTSFAAREIQIGRKWAQSNSVQQSSSTTACIIASNNNVHVVDLAARTCSCRQYQENGIPCGHAMSSIFIQQLSLDPFLPRVLSTAQWIATFEHTMPTIDLTGLEQLEEDVCNPPMTRVPRGRPRKERYRKEEVRTNRGLRYSDMGPGPMIQTEHLQHRCTTCGETGHNVRGCRRPHQ